MCAHVLVHVTDCATLTGIANCALCSEKPDSNSSAPCLACSTGFTLKDNLQSGDDAECVRKYSHVLCMLFSFQDMKHLINHLYVSIVRMLILVAFVSI